MDQDDRRLLPSITMLQCFEAAARYGSASLAATRIGLTQSAVSRHIASLETWLGKALFDRVGRRIVLNEQGGSTSTASPGPWVRSGRRHATCWAMGRGGWSIWRRCRPSECVDRAAFAGVADA
jgi:hypothetical protein